MVDTPFSGFTLVTSLADTDIFLAQRAAGGVSFSGVTLGDFASRNAAQGSAAAPGHAFYGDADTGIFRAAANVLGFSTGGTERARLDGSGNFGIGTASPGEALDVARTGASFVVQKTSNAAGYSKIGTRDTGDAFVEFPVALNFDFWSNARLMRLTGGGQLGIGTNAPAARLHLQDTGSDVRIRITTGATGTSSNTLFDFYGSDGRLGYMGNAGGVFTYFGDVNMLRHSFYTGGSERLRIDSGVSVRPGADNAQDLGTASIRWKVVYAGTGTISTSDERAKQDIEAIPDEWLDAWGAVEWVRFKFRDAVKEKGPLARWHVGLIAQWVRGVFAERGLDAEAIGLLCFDAWEEERDPVFEEQVVDQRTVVIGREGTGILGPDGVEIMRDITEEEDVLGQVQVGERVILEAGDRWGLRYDECQAMEAAWQRRELARKDAAIADLVARVASLEAAA